MSDMPPPTAAIPTRFEVGDVLSRSVSTWLKNFVPFLLLSVLIHAPAIVWMLLTLTGDASPQSPYMKYSGFLNTVLSSILTGALVYAVVMQLQGKSASLSQCVSVGLSRVFPVIGVAIVVGIGVGLGMVLLIVPGVILWLMWFVAIPVAVVERPGVFASMSRSSELTKGSKVAIFLLVLVLVAIGIGITFLLAGALLNSDGLKTYLVLTMALEVIVTAPFSAALAGVSYLTLRRVKEGISADELARVFD
jgi:hypothetical protein